MQRNRTLIVVAVAVMLVAWLAWKVLLTKSAVAPNPVAAPAGQSAPQ
jgi:lipopolysaccharide export system protein LptC